MPIGDYEAVIFVHTDERAATEGGRAVFGDDDSGNGWMRRYFSRCGVVDCFGARAEQRPGCAWNTIIRRIGYDCGCNQNEGNDSK